MENYISAIEQCENIDVAFVINCWKNHEFVMQRDISYMFYGAMQILKPTNDIMYQAIMELDFLNDISHRLENLERNPK